MLACLRPRMMLAVALAAAVALPVAPGRVSANPAENNGGSGIGIGIDLLKLLKKKKKKTAKPAAKKAVPAKKATKKPATAAKPKPPRLSEHAPPNGEVRFRTREVLFILDPAAPGGALAAIVAAQNLDRIAETDLTLLERQLHRYAITDGRSVAAVVTALEGDSRIEIAQPNYSYVLAEAATVTTSVQFANDLMGIPAAHEQATGKDILVAVIDSRIDGDHAGLQGSIRESFSSVDQPAQQADGHGTAMAGAIVGHGMLTGTAPSAALLAVETFAKDDQGKMQGVTYHILRGVDWAHGKGAAIFNLSFAGPRDPLLGQMMKAAVDKGSIFVAAAGNAGSKSPPLYPAAEDTAIAVTALDARRKLYKRANRGKYIDIGAPGVDVIALAPGNATVLSSGTSIATAHMTGLLALAFERTGRFDLARAQELLAQSAEKIEAPANAVGAGLANAPMLLTKASEILKPEETQ